MLIELPDNITPGTQEAVEFFQQSFANHRSHRLYGTKVLSQFVPFTFVKVPGDNAINVKSYLLF